MVEIPDRLSSLARYDTMHRQPVESDSSTQEIISGRVRVVLIIKFPEHLTRIPVS